MERKTRHKIYMRYVPLYFILTIAITTLASTIPDSLSAEAPYYISLRDHLSVYTHGITKLNEIEIRDKKSDYPIQFKPNENFNVGFGFNYKWLGMGLTFNLAAFNNDDALYGRTESFDFQTDAYLKSLLLTANVQAYKGFYWDNIDDYHTDWNTEDSVPLRPDIQSYSMGISAFHTVNNEKFSLKASYHNTYWQKRSAGSWLTGGQASAYIVKGNEPLVPNLLAEQYPEYDSLLTLATLSLGTNFGYSYTWVFLDYFYLNATLIIGFSLQVVKALDILGREILNDARLSGKSHFRLAFGFNSDENYGGFMFIMDSYPVRNNNEAALVYKYGRFRLFYGKHFSW